MKTHVAQDVCTVLFSGMIYEQSSRILAVRGVLLIWEYEDLKTRGLYQSIEMESGNWLYTHRTYLRGAAQEI